MCFIWQQRRVDRILSSTFVTNGGNTEAVGNPNQTNIVSSIADGPTQFLPSVRELFISDSNFRNEVNRDPEMTIPACTASRLVRLIRQNSVRTLVSSSRRLTSDVDSGSPPPSAPSLPGPCCMSGCANCVWLDYAEEMVTYYQSLGKKMELTELLNTLEDNVDDPMVKAFLKMELKSKYQFSK